MAKRTKAPVCKKGTPCGFACLGLKKDGKPKACKQKANKELDAKLDSLALSLKAKAEKPEQIGGDTDGMDDDDFEIMALELEAIQQAQNSTASNRQK